MEFDEIVGAVIDSNKIISNLESINACRALGYDVRFVTRKDAQLRAQSDPSGEWSAMANGRTLFFTKDGALYRPRVRNASA